MDKREPSYGCVIVSVELPRHLADLLAERRGDFMAIIERLGRECQHLPPSAEVQAEADRLREQENKERQEKFKKLGRAGYRKLRQSGFGKNLAKSRNAIKVIAPQFDVSWQTLEYAIERFKHELDSKRRQRRGREIERLYWDGKSNDEIASRQKVHRNTIVKYIREVIKPTGRRS